MSWWIILVLVALFIIIVPLINAKRPTKEEYIQAEKDKVHQVKVKKWRERQKEINELCRVYFIYCHYRLGLPR